MKSSIERITWESTDWQVGTPRALYERPANAFVARFIGQPGMNVFQVPLRVSGGKLTIAFGDFYLEVGPERAEKLRSYVGDDELIGIRPQARVLTQDEDLPVLPATVAAVEFRGHETELHLLADIATAAPSTGAWSAPVGLVAVIPGQPLVRRGDAVRLRFDPASLHFFTSAGETINGHT